MKDKLNEEFLQALKEVEAILLEMLFKRHSFVEKGFAYFAQYKRGNTIVEFIFGPSDWETQMIIYAGKKYAFKDLLEIPTIKEWVNKNPYRQENERSIKDEILWFIELLQFSLPILIRINSIHAGLPGEGKS